MTRLVHGNEAIFLGAVSAGAGFYAGYPISPSSEIMAEAAKYSDRHPEFKFLQAEDEIASSMAVIGASLAGAKSFTATSGPGFSLMQESIGFAYMAQVPCVYVNAQRVGPSTGMPTQAAQADILQTYHGTHGDVHAIAFYPNSVLECYRYTAWAFNAAEEAKSPVVLLSDALLSHLYEPVDLDTEPVVPQPRQVPPLGTGTRSFTGLVADSQGVPRTSTPQTYREWLRQVRERHAAVAAKYNAFEYIPNDRADTLLISFGIISRVIRPLVGEFGYFRPIRLLPVPVKELAEAAKHYRRIVVVEGNDGQYSTLMQAALLREVETVPVLGGKVSLAEIRAQLAALPK